MGAGASSGSCGILDSSEDVDLYQILGVSSDASEEEIKRAYRKQVLLHHPDKNPDDAEGSTRRFLSVQEAHDTLIDTQRRADYDYHQSLPRETTNSTRSSSSQEGGWISQLFNMFSNSPLTNPAFRSSSNSRFSGFNKNQEAFLSKFDPINYKRSQGSTRSPGISPADIIEYISLVEYPSADEAGNTNAFALLKNLFDCLAYDEVIWGYKQSIPSFGTSRSVWCREDLRPGEHVHTAKEFYLFWTKFLTAKGFNWITPYDEGKALDERAARFIRKLNKPYQDHYRQHYNELIQTLAKALQDSDPRYKAHLLRKEMKQQAHREEMETQQKNSNNSRKAESQKRKKRNKKKKNGTTW